MASKQRKATRSLFTSLIVNRNQILDLLEDLRDSYPELSREGDYRAFRVANARHAATAKGILAVIEASEAYPFKKDFY